MEINEEYIKEIKDKFDLKQVESYFEKLSELRVLVIGDTIIDRYIFVDLKGRAVKDPILSTEYKSKETYAGGVLAVANHIGDFVKKIKLVTLIGDQNSMLDFIKKSIKNNIEIKTFTKGNSPTTVKQRMIDFYRFNKLFKVEYINDKPISNTLTEEIINYLEEEPPKYDLVIVSDFGHGFINDTIRRKIEEKSRFLALNVQSNSANMGYNYINHYKNTDFIVMNDEELRLPLMKRFEEIQDVITEFHNTFKHKKFLVTVGKHGCIFFNQGNIYKAHVLTNQVVDTVGAGDAVFALASLFTYINADNQLIPFIANCAGGIKSNYMGNKESITKEKLLNFIKKLYKNGLE